MDEPEGVTLRKFPWYIIYEDGRIWSNVKHKYLKSHGSKYLRLRVTKIKVNEEDVVTKQQVHTSVHWLVAKAYVSNPNAYADIDHLDSDTKNNHASNLEWVTRSENIRRAHQKVGRKSTKHPVIQLTKQSKFVKEYPSISDASRETGISHGDICSVLSGKLKTAGKHLWAYKTKPLDRKRMVLSEELWKQHPEYEKYEISTLGRVFSKKSSTVLSQTLSQNYYTCFVDGGPKLVHRLVADTFLVKPHPKLKHPVVNHKDNNKLNNTLGNLEWLSTSDNTKDTYLKELSSAAKPCVQYTLVGVKVATFVSCQEAQRQTGIHARSIGQVCEGAPKYKTAGGSVWRWKGDPFDRGDGEYKPQEGGKAKGCTVYNPDGTCVAEYPSLEAASKATGVDVKNIGKVCRQKERRDGKPKLAGGSAWRYLGEEF